MVPETFNFETPSGRGSCFVEFFKHKLLPEKHVVVINSILEEVSTQKWIELVAKQIVHHYGLPGKDTYFIEHHEFGGAFFYVKMRWAERSLTYHDPEWLKLDTSRAEEFNIAHLLHWTAGE